METKTKKRMRCRYCGSTRLARAGWEYNAQGKIQRFRCAKCKKHSTIPYGLGNKKKAGG